ncbi:hypothetical protein GCM10009846_29210 [Agrococcus versicolor]|uniref:Uncharacterized protein n=2 Tax=Agrococcus versicolor TaxID=501482 RepID=A0ABN3AXS1_9MICO
MRTTAARHPATTVVVTGVGLVGVGFGTLLTAAPRRGGRWLRLDATSIRRRRTLGIVDLTLGVAILGMRGSRRRWLPLAAHSVMHLPYAREYLRDRRPVGAAVMCGLLAFDAVVAVAARPR